MAELRYLKDADGNIIYPVTHTDAIIGDINNNDDSNEYQTITDTNLSTENKTVVGAINEIYQNVNNSKQLIASAIGEPLNAEDTFSAMSNDINGLLATFKTNMMNNGVTVESSDKFKSLIDKIATLADNESKGIKLVSGQLNESMIGNSNGGSEGVNAITFSEELSIIPSRIFVLFDKTGYYNSGVGNRRFTVDSLHNYSLETCTQVKDDLTGRLGRYYITNITTKGFDLNWSNDGSVQGLAIEYLAILGEGEDTTFRDSLASILIDEGVEVSEEDDMASLITKVDEEFDNKNANSGLNIISATALPATGKENQICVITDTPVDNFVVTPNYADKIDNIDTITLYIGNTSSMDTNLASSVMSSGGDVNIKYYFNRILQGNDRLASYVYQNSQWNSLTVKSIPVLENNVYLHSDIYEFHTGGYMNYNADYGLRFNPTASTGDSRIVGTTTKNKINFSDFNTIKIKAYASLSGYNHTLLFCACNASLYNYDVNQSLVKNSLGVVAQSSMSVPYSPSTNIVPTEFIIDLTEWVGSYYIGFIASTNYQYSADYIYITDIELI